MGVAVRRYIDILIYNNYAFCLLHLYQQHPYFFVHLKNVLYIIMYVCSGPQLTW